MKLSEKIDEGLRRREFAEVPPIVRSAIEDRDALGFYRGCVITGYTPQGRAEGELFEQGNFETGIQVNQRTEKVRTSRGANYEAFIAYVKKVGINLSQLQDIGLKREALKRAGYSNLWVGKAEKVPIDRAGEGRIQMTFSRVYQEAIK